jgi:hypothetical protein
VSSTIITRDTKPVVAYLLHGKVSPKNYRLFFWYKVGGSNKSKSTMSTTLLIALGMQFVPYISPLRKLEILERVVSLGCLGFQNCQEIKTAYLTTISFELYSSKYMAFGIWNLTLDKKINRTLALDPSEIKI